MIHEYDKNSKFDQNKSCEIKVVHINEAPLKQLSDLLATTILGKNSRKIKVFQTYINFENKLLMWNNKMIEAHTHETLFQYLKVFFF